MRLKAFVICFLLSLYGFSAPAQPPAIPFKQLTSYDGLSHNSVVAIAEDSYGFLWFATPDGLNRYDGRSFLRFPKEFENISTPVHAQLGKLAIAGNKLLLIAEGGRLEAFNMLTQEFQTISSLGKEAVRLPPVSAVHVDGNQDIWIGTLHHGVYRLDQKTETLRRYTKTGEGPNTLSSNQIRSIFEDSNRQVWIVTDKGLNQLSNDSSMPHLPGLNAHVLIEDAQQTLWLGTFGKGLYRKLRGAADFEPFRGFAGQPLPDHLIISSLYADSDGRIWVGTQGDGLYIISPGTAGLQQLMPDKRNPQALGARDILSIHQDRKGGIWIGTEGGGLSYYHRQFTNFSRLTYQEVADTIAIEQIRAITTDGQGGVWLGTFGGGLTSYSPASGSLQTHSLRPGMPWVTNYNRVVSLLADGEGDLWVGTQDNGLLVMNPHNQEIRRWFLTEARYEEDRVPDNTVWAMWPKGNGQVWAATRHAGLLLLDKQRGLLAQHTLRSAEGKGPLITNVRALVQINDSTLALGLERKGIQLLNTRTGVFTPLSNPGLDRSLGPATAIRCLYYQQGWLWAGTAGKGIVITNLVSGHTLTLGEAEGLTNNMIYGILPEGDGVVWVSSNKGLSRIAYAHSAQGIHISHIMPYTAEDGLQGNEFSIGAAHRTANGTLYFGGHSGLNYFSPAAMAYTREPLPVVLTEGMIGNRPMALDTLITYKKQLRLNHWENSLSFTFTALDFISPEKLNYQYQLEGYDTDWVAAGSRNYAAYTNLPPGNYTFRVKVADYTALQETVPSALAITIATPYWRQAWFMVLAVAMGIGLLYGLYRYRINQLLKVQRVKNLISADLHDDIGSRLTNIQFLSALSRSRLQASPDAGVLLDGINEQVQASAEALDEIVWNIKMKDESLDDIVARMRRYAGEMLENEAIVYTVEITTDFAGQKMSMQKRRELFMVFKELLSNIRKHAQAKKVAITISRKDHMFYLAVQDDGKGFDPAAATHRNGIRNTRERVKRWKGTMTIRSARQQGTLVELWIPFDRNSLLRKIALPTGALTQRGLSLLRLRGNFGSSRA
jgi:ligand-binding sensor domain-containing protein/signal transduction histidine kinase